MEIDKQKRQQQQKMEQSASQSAPKKKDAFSLLGGRIRSSEMISKSKKEVLATESIQNEQPTKMTTGSFNLFGSSSRSASSKAVIAPAPVVEEEKKQKEKAFPLLRGWDKPNDVPAPADMTTPPIDDKRVRSSSTRNKISLWVTIICSFAIVLLLLVIISQREQICNSKNEYLSHLNRYLQKTQLCPSIEDSSDSSKRMKKKRENYKRKDDKKVKQKKSIFGALNEL